MTLRELVGVAFVAALVACLLVLGAEETGLLGGVACLCGHVVRQHKGHG
jgi:hypothetical protein